MLKEAQSTQERLAQTSLRDLVPQRVFEVAHDKNAVVIEKLASIEGNIGILVYERNYPTMLTDPEVWKKYITPPEINPGIKIQFGNSDVLDEPPQGIDRLHFKYKRKIEKGELRLTDRILMTCRVSVMNNEIPSLYVGDYDGEKATGIASDFYFNALPAVAKALNVRFITGYLNGSNIGFFTKKIGRYTFDQLKPEFAAQLYPRAKPNTIAYTHHTVQFLYEEDKEKYLK